jgi:uncharacterized protein (TIGR03437 family)
MNEAMVNRLGGDAMMRNRHMLWAVLAVLVLVSNCLAQPYFLRKDVVVGPNPTAVIAGDFNGDGRPDLGVGANEGIAVLLNTGDGTFGQPVVTPAPPNLFWLPAARDFNNDGKDDLVGSGFVFLSRGDGTFLPGRYIGAQEAVAAADFNRDGKVDLIVSDYDWSTGALKTHGVRVLLGNGDGTFHFSGNVMTTAATQIQTADFNGDGRTDLAIVPMPSFPEVAPGATVVVTPPPVQVFLGQGDGAFGSAIAITTPPTSWLLTADFDGDGVQDLLTAGGILPGRGDGTFRPAVPFGDRPGSPFLAADFTGDGKADLVVFQDRSVVVLPGKGDGTFSPATQPALRTASYVRMMIALDVDGDRRPDLVTVNAMGTNVVSILTAKPQDAPALRRAVSAASGIAIVSPESLAVLYLDKAAGADAGATPPWPTRLGGLSLEIRDAAGTSRPAPLLYVSDTQINFQVPPETALGEAALTIVHDGGSTPAGGMQVDAVAPALFTVSPDLMQPAGTGVMVNPDGTQVPVPVCCDPIPLSAAAGRPIYLSFFGTGFHGANSDTVTCSADGIRLPVLYAGPQRTPGVDQINVQLLPKVLEGRYCEEWWGCDPVYVTIRIGGVPANSFWLSVQ